MDVDSRLSPVPDELLLSLFGRVPGGIKNYRWVSKRLYKLCIASLKQARIDLEDTRYGRWSLAVLNRALAEFAAKFRHVEALRASCYTDGDRPCEAMLWELVSAMPALRNLHLNGCITALADIALDTSITSRLAARADPQHGPRQQRLTWHLAS